jgi:hypothetical protein
MISTIAQTRFQLMLRPPCSVYGPQAELSLPMYMKLPPQSCESA